MDFRRSVKVTALCGGVGGSKFVAGLADLLAGERLTIIGNTGDDFYHFGLKICPDLDTVMYRLSGRVNLETGWGRDRESWRVMGEIRRLNGPDWFQLGDQDLAVHLLRTQWLNEGLNLTEVTGRLYQQFGVIHKMLPMSDQSAPTRIVTPTGVLGFQEWFVKERWQPAVKQVLLPEGVSSTEDAVQALEDADVIIIVPSNPYISIDPILNANPIKSILRRRRKHVVALSPLVGDDAVKGPFAKMVLDRKLPVNAATVLDHYRPYISGFIQDYRDAVHLSEQEIPVLIADTLMKTRDDQQRLASKVLKFTREL